MPRPSSRPTASPASLCQTGRDVWVYARYANTSSQKILSLPAGIPHAEMDTYIFGRQNPTLTKVTQTIAQAIGAAEMLEGTLKTLRAEEEVWSWEGMMSALDGVTVVQFTAMAANAILAKARKASTPFQEALVSLEVKLRDCQRECEGQWHYHLSLGRVLCVPHQLPGECEGPEGPRAELQDA